ncbi:MAG TPA: D-ribose pyranase [Candidatus Limnocylindrales bacterium]|nr:D-ribose pyranase [Candidatus Limnocylindrales bacterium]
MKRSGLLNPELLAAIAELGHTDEFIVCDGGYPIPDGLPRIDLAYRPGMPPFLDVLEAIMAEVVAEGAVIAEEASAEVAASIEALVGPAERLPHSELKDRGYGARFAVRTGEFTPYSNVIVICGVPF